MATGQTVRAKMEELRTRCQRHISTRLQSLDSSFSSFQSSLHSLKSQSQSTAANQVKLGELKVELRGLEDELVRALAVKTRKEAKRLSAADSLDEARVKVDELQKLVRDQAARKDEYAAILSQQSKSLAESEERSGQAIRHIQEIQEACTWYNNVLGFRIDGGHGVKFTFTCISRKFPNEEYSFTVRHTNDGYTLLECKPHLDDTERLVHELNKSNGLYKFVRLMRWKFLSAASGSMSSFIYQNQDSTSISVSAPFSSISSDSRSQSTPPLREEANGAERNHNSREGLKSPLQSPVSGSSHRRSSRISAKKQREC